MTDKIVQEVAEAEFERFAELMDLDVNPSGMDAEDKKGFDQQKERIVSAIRSGSLALRPAIHLGNWQPTVRHTTKDMAATR